MSATQHDQIWFIVLFSLAALFLLIRLHALEERTTWIRRRIGDPAIVGSLYLRGGTVFVMIAVFLAFVLTATAHSAPLAGFWDDAKPALVDISQWLQRLIPAAPDSRTLGVPSFGGQVTIGGLWTTSNDPALEIDRARRRQARPLLAGDHVRLLHPDRLDDDRRRRPTDRAAGEDLLGGTLDAIPDQLGPRAVDVPGHSPELAVPRRVQPDRSAVGRPRHDPAPVRRRTASSSRSRSDGARTPSRRRFRPSPTSRAG